MARRVLVSIAVLALLAAGVGAVWVLRIHPLAHGDYFSCGLREIDVRGRACVVEYRHGKTTIWAFTLRNEGSVGVTVTDVELPGSEEGMLPVETVLMWPRSGLGVFHLKEGGLVPLEPFALGPGEERLVAFQGRFANCERFAAGTSDAYAAVDVHFRLFGIPREDDVRLWSYLEVEAPADCPA